MNERPNSDEIFNRTAAGASASTSKPRRRLSLQQHTGQVSGPLIDNIHRESRVGELPTAPGRSRKRAREHLTSFTTNADEEKLVGGDDETPFKSNIRKLASSTSKSRQNKDSSAVYRSLNKSSPYPYNPYVNGRRKSNLNSTIGTGSDISIPSSGIKEENIQTDPQEVDGDDYYAGIDDNDILEIDDTPFKSTTSSTIDHSTPQSLLSKVIMLSSSEAKTVAMETEQKQETIRESKQHSIEKVEMKYDESSFSPTNVITNLDSNEFKRNCSDSEDTSEEKNMMLSLDQLTQEEVDFDAMFELLEDADGYEDDQFDEEEDEYKSEKMAPKSRDHCESRAFKQPSLSQFYYATKPKPKIPNFLEYNGRHFMKGDVWQLKPEASKFVDRNLIVKIKGFSHKRGHAPLAIVENKFYLCFESVLYIGSDQARSVIEDRKLKGRLGPRFVEYKQMRSSSDSTTPTPVQRFSLDRLAYQIKENVTSDFIFGYEGIKNFDEKAGCFFKSCESGVSQKKRISIPKNAQGKFTMLELYSGAGGFSIGLEDAGFAVTHHVDNYTTACSTLQANFRDSNVLQRSVEDFLTGCIRNPTSKQYPKKGSITLVHGSTPCQGFSMANRNSSANDAANNAETYQFMDVVRHFRPPFVTFENVLGMTKKINLRYVQKMVAEFIKMGYQVRTCHVDASDYGDPQVRVRFFILASKEGLALPNLPQPSHGDGLPFKKKTVADALGFLEDIEALDYEGEVWANVDGIETGLQGHVLRSSEWKPDDVKLWGRNSVLFFW